MPLPLTAEQLIAQLPIDSKMGDIKKWGTQIKKDHDLALALWESQHFPARLLAVLIADKKELCSNLLDQWTLDMQIHPYEQRNLIMDWLMANQLFKDKKTLALVGSWQNSTYSLQRRTYWYYQGRLRWMGKTAPTNNEELLAKIETDLPNEAPEVQWAMNFVAGWIGVYDLALRTRCIALGEKTGIYQGKKVHKGCTPEYLPDFIAIESQKRGL